MKSFLPVAVALVVLTGLQLGLGQSDYFVYLASLVGVNVVLAVSLNIINGMTGQFSIGHAGFMAVGAYVSGTVSLIFKDDQLTFVPPVVSDQLFFVTSLIVGGVTAGLFGFLVGLPSLRLRGDYLAIVTLGFGEIIRVFIQNTDSMATFAATPPEAGASWYSIVAWKLFSPIGSFVGHFGGALGVSGVPQRSSLFMVGLWVFVVVLLAKRLGASSHGRSLKAIREDEVAAEAMGVDTTSYKVRAFVVSSFFAGIAGGLLAHFVPIINPGSFTFVRSMEVVVMVVAGGLGSSTGAIVAAVFLTLLPEGLRSLFLQLGGGDATLAQKVDQIRMPIYGVLLVLIMLTRSQGLFGTHEVWDIWKGRKPTLVELLSAFNWFNLFLSVIGLFVVVLGNQVTGGARWAVALGVIAVGACYGYLAVATKKYRARGLQTVLAVLSIAAVPVGTLYGALALFVCWRSSEFAPRFQNPESVAGS